MMINRTSWTYLVFLLLIGMTFFIDCRKESSVNEASPLWHSELNLPMNPYNYQNPKLASFLHDQFISVADNTPDENQVSDWGATLGRVLFYDKRLSKNKLISCGSCHIQQYGFSDTARFSRGFDNGKTKRHSMSLVNSRYYVSGNFFWDERAKSLESQVLEPIKDHVEMGMTLDSVIVRLKKTAYYAQLFQYAFGSQKIDTVTISKALSQFVRSIVSYQSKFDVGRERVSRTSDNFPNFTQSENRGKAIFFKKNDLSCSSCHMTAAFFGDMARNNGLSLTSDRGVGGISNNNMDMFTFKSPSLKNIAIRPPYMHDGRFSSLSEVIDHYSSGISEHNYIDPHFKTATGIFQFNLTPLEKQDLINFLNTLTDEKLLTDQKFSDPNYP